MRRVIALFLALLILSQSAGCLRGESLDRYGYVMGLGVDLGETLPYKLTLMLQKQDVSSDAQKNGGFALVTAECRSLFEAIETISSSLPYQLDFARMALMVLSQDVASDPKAMEGIFDISLPRLRIRYNIHLFVSLPSAYETLKGFENELDPNLSKMQMNFVNYSEKTGLAPMTNVSLFREASDSKTYDVLMPLCGVTGELTTRQPQDSVGTSEYEYIAGRLLIESEMKTALAGSAIFSGGKMVGILDGRHTQHVLMATGQFREGRYRMPGPDGRQIELHLQAKGAPKRWITLSGKPHAHTEIKLTADIEQPESGFELPPEQLEEWIGENIQAEFDALFTSCRDLSADVFGFGKLAITQFTSAADWEAYEWMQAYQGMTASFAVRVELIRNPNKSALE